MAPTECVALALNTMDLYLFCLALLGLLAYKTRRSADRNTAQSRFFRLMLALNAALLLVDGLSTGLNGYQGKGLRVLLELVSTANLSLQTLAAYSWLRFVREVAGAGKERRAAQELLLALPLMLDLAMLISSPLTGLGYSYDSGNHYRRTAGGWFVILSGFAYLALAYAVAFRARTRMDRKKYAALLGFVVAPAIGGLAQVFVPSVMLVWPALAISLLVSYLAVQNEQLFLDHLTGINNRRSLDLALRRRIEEARHSGIFGLILIDLDDFKAINDTYGHLEGDRALEATARILRKCFHHRDFLSRYGGDEFLVIADLRNPEDLDAIERRLEDEFRAWNAGSGGPWSLAFSLGCASFGPDLDLGPDECLRRVDERLYERKKGKKGGRGAEGAVPAAGAPRPQSPSASK